MRFLPTAWFTPVLPPTLASTIASSVVGTCTNGTPRRRVAATNPAMSPMTPPPRAMTVVFRSILAQEERVVRPGDLVERLVLLAGGDDALGVDA